MKTISLDTETTGVDFFHSARPFFVTISHDSGETESWEWDVDPLTREVDIIFDDVEAIRERIAEADRVVMQNGKFDVRALQTIGIEDWDWSKTEDTLIAGHVLGSNHKHDLTSMVRDYLGEELSPYEDALEQSAKECRSKVQQARLKVKRLAKKEQREFFEEETDPISLFRIAEEKMENNPSLSGKNIWKSDGWLPRVMAQHCDDPQPQDGCKHRWRETGKKEMTCERCKGNRRWIVLSEYGNFDSASTLLLFREMEEKLRGRKLWDIYRQKMKSVPVGCRIEERGATYNSERLLSLREEYACRSERLKSRCVSIAKSYKFDLVMPKGASNGSLREFCFDVMKLPPVYNKKAKSSAPCLDAKNAIPFYRVTLDHRLRPYHFINSLSEKRTVDTALTYLAAYERFALRVGDDPVWRRLHSTLNPTGSDTLRWSSENPNMQNVKKDPDADGRSIRWIFGPPPGREWFSLDAKNIELRIPAYESGQQEFIDLFERADDPPYYGSNHMLMFHLLWPDLWDEAVKEVGIEKAGPHCKKKYVATYYQWIKNGNFAVQYGAIDRVDGSGTADLAYHQKGAQAKIKARFAKGEALNQKWIRFAERNGYVETLPDKSVDPLRGYPLLCTRTEWGKVLPTVPLNYHVQGTAMWWTQQAMIRCQEKLDEWREMDGFDGYINFQVHDELVFDFPKRGDVLKDLEDERNRKTKFRTQGSSNLWRVRVLQKIMSKGGDDIGIPTPVGAEWHQDNWLEGVTL